MRNDRSKKQAIVGTVELKERGWTAGLIRKFLGEPDRTASNPYHRTGPEIKYWLESKVIKIEQADEFRKAKEKANVRSRATTAAAARQREQLLTEVEKMPITVTKLPIEEIKRRCLSPAALDDQEFVDRTCVNYIRHELTDYDHHLAEVAGKIGGQAAVSEIRSRIFNAIADAYPECEHECHRQELKKIREEDLTLG